MAKYLNSAGVTYLWKRIKALLAKPFTVSAGDSEGNYTKVGGGSVATGNSDGDQTIIDNNGVTVSGGALTLYEDTSKGGASAVIDYAEATRLKGLKNYTLPAANGETLGGVKSGEDVTIANGVITVKDDSHNHTIANVDGLQTALDAKAPLASPTFTGTPKAPTAASGTNTTQIATTAFVQAAVDSKVAAADAMRFKGTLGTGGTITALPASHKVGDTYKVITAGTYAGQKCEVGDMVICVTAGSTANDAHWTVVQSNVDGAVTGPTSAVSGRVAVFNGTTGKVIKDSGFTIAKSVPADAKFTDTTYGLATTSANGLMSKEDKAKMDDFLDEISLNVTQTGEGLAGDRKYYRFDLAMSAYRRNGLSIDVIGNSTFDFIFDNVSDLAPGMMTPSMLEKLNGIDEDIQSALGNVPLAFDGIVDDDITVQSQSTVNYTSVLWSSKKEVFVAKGSDGLYYSNWGKTDRYGAMNDYIATSLYVLTPSTTASVLGTYNSVYARVRVKNALGGEWVMRLMKVGEVNPDSEMSDEEIDAAIAAAG